MIRSCALPCPGLCSSLIQSGRTAKPLSCWFKLLAGAGGRHNGAHR